MSDRAREKCGELFNAVVPMHCVNPKGHPPGGHHFESVETDVAPSMDTAHFPICSKCRLHAPSCKCNPNPAAENQADAARIGEIRKRVEKASAGPWCWDNRGDKCDDIQIGVALDANDTPLEGNINNFEVDEVDYCESIAGEVKSPLDADFIAHAREDIPYLLAEVERLRVQEQCLREFGRQTESELASTLQERDVALSKFADVWGKP